MKTDSNIPENVENNFDKDSLQNQEVQREITLRKLAEMELREHSKILEAFFQNTISLVAILNRDFNFIRVNEAYAKADNRSASEFPGHNHFEFYPSDAEEIFKEVVETKKEYHAIARPFTYKYSPERGITYWDWSLTPVLNEYDEIELLIFNLVNVTTRKKAEIELESLFNLSKDLFIIFDYSGKLIRVNPAFEQLVGLTQVELIGKSGIDFIHPEDVKKPVNARTLKMKTSNFKNRIKCDGSYRWVEWNSIPVDGLFYLVGRDVTERMLFEEKLRISEESFRTSVENMLDCFGIFSAIRNGDGKIVDFFIEYMNESACLNNKLSKEEQIGKSFLSLFPGHIKSGLFSDYMQVVDSGKPLIKDSIYYDDHYNNNATGAYDIRAVKLGDGIAVSWRDITERKQAEEALLLSEERFSKSFSASPVAMIITTIQDAEIIDINQSFLNKFGYKRNEIISNTTIDLNLWVDVAKRDKTINIIHEHGSIYNTEFQFRKKNGDIVIGLFSGVIIDINGKQCLLSIINDITERKNFEKELSRLDRLNLVGEMAASIGHEIRNPMTAVRGFLQFLGNKQECANYKEYYDIMIEELDRANAIITEYLSLAKNKIVSLKKHNLNSILTALSPLIHADAIRENKNVIEELGDIPDLLLDEKEIRQLVLNLVRNGFQAMSPGGNLTIKTFRDDCEVVLAVGDQGKGIEPHVMEKIGTPFFTTKDHGTGLGLAVCYSIAARHNAIIKVETSPIGTTFFVRFKPPEN